MTDGILDKNIPTLIFPWLRIFINNEFFALPKLITTYFRESVIAKETPKI